MTDRFATRLTLALTLAVAAAIGVGTLVPLPGALRLPGSDKLHHFAAFAVLVLPVAALRPRWSLAAVLLALAYGAAIELVQPHIGRTGDVADLAADAAGVAVGMGAGRLLARAVRGWRPALR